jgi:hypothetical protein
VNLNVPRERILTGVWINLSLIGSKLDQIGSTTLEMTHKI